MTVRDWLHQHLDRLTPPPSEPETRPGIEEYTARGMLVESVVQAALAHNLVEPVIELFDMDRFLGRLAELKAAFPSFWTHALAIKANAFSGILLEAKSFVIIYYKGSACGRERHICKIPHRVWV
jgi:hypothetical protein